MAASKPGTSEEMPKLLRFLSSLLQRVADSNDSILLNLRRRSLPEKVSVFHGLSRPSISIHTYLERIFKYANCSTCCFVVAYVYLDRFVQMQPLLPINSLSVHRLLITSVMVAVKFMEDLYYNNAYYAKIGGISTAEMNCLEVDFLFGLGFHLNVSPDTYYTYCCYLQREVLLLHQKPLTRNIDVVDVADNDHDCSSSPSPSSLNIEAVGKSVKHLQCSNCFNEDETSHQPQVHELTP